jgi:hypothetical protein
MKVGHQNSWPFKYECALTPNDDRDYADDDVGVNEHAQYFGRSGHGPFPEEAHLHLSLCEQNWIRQSLLYEFKRCCKHFVLLIVMMQLVSHFGEKNPFFGFELRCILVPLIAETIVDHPVVLAHH